MPAQPTCENEPLPFTEDAEDLVRDADAIMEELVLQAPAGVDLNVIAQWKRRKRHYFGATS